MSIRVFYDILNQKGTPAFYTDTLANRPAFGFAGRVFISTDSGQIFEDTGSAWTLIADAGVGGGTLSSVCLNGNTTATGIVITAGGLSTNSVTNTGNTTGSVLFAGSGGLESQSNSTFFWDNTNKRLGIGNASPGAPLDVHGTGTQIQVNGTGTNNSYIQFQNAGTSKWRIGNNYNAGANSFDIFNSVLSTSALSISNSTNALTINYSIFSELGMLIKNGTVLTATGYTGIGSTATSLLINLGNSGRTGTLTFQTGADYTYTFPAATGTLALTSNIPANIITGTGVANQVSLFTGTNTVIGASNLTFDNTNARMGVNASSFTLTAQVTSYSTTQSNQFKAAGTAPGYTFSDGTSTVTYGGAIGGATAANNFITGSAAGDICITNQSLSAGAILFGIGTSEKMRLNSTGNLGIGSSNPVATLHLRGSGTSGQVTGTQIWENFSSGTLGLEITGAAGSSYASFKYGGGPGTGTNGLTNALAIKLEGASAGFVGINTTSPNALLHLSQNAVNLNLYLQNTSGSGKTWAVNSDNAGSFNIHDTFTNKFTIGSAGYISINGGANYTDAGCVNTVISTASQFCYSGLNSNGSNPRGIYLNFTNTTGGDYAYYLQASGAAKFYVNGNGVIYSTNTSVQAISDIRLKENIRDIDKGLTEINKLKPRLFDWKEGKGTGNKNVMGFVAQEIEEIFPELITEFNENVDSLETFKAIAMSNLIPYLVKAIQELNEKLVRNNIN